MTAAVYANAAAERAIVGAALLGYSDGLAALDPVTDLVTDPRLVVIAEAIRAVAERGRVVEPAAVLAAVQATPDFPWARTSQVGVLLAELSSIEVCPVPMQAVWLAQTVRALSGRRRLALAAKRLANWAATDFDLYEIAHLIAGELEDVQAAIQRGAAQPDRHYEATRVPRTSVAR